MKKIYIIIVLVVLLAALTLTGCGGDALQAEVVSYIDFYSLAMSSVPGFPLEVILPENENAEDYLYIWKTDSGEFLEWRVNLEIMHLGDDAEMPVPTIFWSPLGAGAIDEGGASIKLKIKSTGTGRTAARLKLNIIKKEDGMYYLETGE